MGHGEEQEAGAGAVAGPLDRASVDMVQTGRLAASVPRCAGGGAPTMRCGRVGSLTFAVWNAFGHAFDAHARLRNPRPFRALICGLGRGRTGLTAAENFSDIALRPAKTGAEAPGLRALGEHEGHAGGRVYHPGNRGETPVSCIQHGRHEGREWRPRRSRACCALRRRPRCCVSALAQPLSWDQCASTSVRRRPTMPRSSSRRTGSRR